MEPKNWQTLAVEDIKRMRAFEGLFPSCDCARCNESYAAEWAAETLPKLRKVIAAMRAHAEDAAWPPSYRNALAKFLPDLAALLPWYGGDRRCCKCAPPQERKERSPTWASIAK